jgi:hypothetical protein
MSAPHRIHLTGAPPISITDEQWPIVGRAIWYDGPTPRDSDVNAYVRIRRSNATGRWLVYGVTREQQRTARAGMLATTREQLTVAIYDVCAVVGIEPQRVFDALPYEEVA